MKQIIKVLNSKMTLEEEFEMKKQINVIEKETDINEVKMYSVDLLKTASKQGHFVSMALEIICDQQDVIFKYEADLKKKKATFMSRFLYVLFGKD